MLFLGQIRVNSAESTDACWHYRCTLHPIHVGPTDTGDGKGSAGKGEREGHLVCPSYVNVHCFDLLLLSIQLLHHAGDRSIVRVSD